MKKYNNIIKLFTVLLTGIVLTGCLDDLDQLPISTVAPEIYFTSESQLQSYVNNLYQPRNKDDNGHDRIFDVHDGWSFGSFGLDSNSDNMNNKSAEDHFIPGQWKVGQTEGEWNFDYIYKCNYFLTHAGEKLANGEISGNTQNINQSFGEVYFFRAYMYFKRLQKLGDFPIITEPIPNEMEPLIEASKRSPRTEVVRFILSDLNKAIELMKEDKSLDRKTRLNAYTAYMLKSRVALYEASWMKYFKGTAFVPGGEGWPGANKEYNKNYTIGNYDALVDSLYQVCMDASKIIADNYPLVENNGILPQSETDALNPYMEMFASVDLSGTSEVIFWREYSRGLGISHNVPIGAQTGGYVNGLTRGYVDNFVMANGLPIYAANSGYTGDNYISEVRQNRDGRLWLFLKEPGQKNLLFNTEGVDRANPIEDYPNITSSNGEAGYGTGYSIRKGGTFDGSQLTINNGCYTGAIVFRSTEALLNYLEACYEKNSTLDGTAQEYWRRIRSRAGVDTDYTKTINATIMSEEAKNDWAAYSAGTLLTDATLYNIRRERRSELMAEGLRLSDLRRWRAMDQLIENPYHLEGFKLWGPMQHVYVDDEGKTILKHSVSDANVSAPTDDSDYFRPLEINPTSLVLAQKGVKWAMAHYLDPIAVEHFQITSDGGGIDNSPIYQNPYWPTTAGEGALR